MKKYKTKFPVARIKKIMRLDDEVGKVALVTPIMISKALELFMESLITEACKITREREAKKVTPHHLKRAIMETEQFDFLRELVESLPDPTEVADPDDEQSKGRGRGGGRKPKGTGSSHV
ncbi:H2A super protein [Gaertneriomyces sp. JEL0708]|nr:DNA polymerase epsilon subunit C [Gaertneriomyces semiglobifer]KAJ3190164.1 H2A super protein [Gaertneriomyces sp. JEL0708]